jgi:hypothetical protein
MITFSAALGLALLTAPARADKLDASNKKATTACLQSDRDLLVKRKPGCSAEISRAGARVLMSYNALGLRDKDYPRTASSGITRALVIGGSLMAAPGLEEKDAPPRALERALRRRGLSVEVVNASGEGYTGWQNAVRLKEFLGAYAPKLVVYHLASHYIFTDRALWYDLRFDRGDVRGRLPPLRGALKALHPLLMKTPGVFFAIRVYEEQWGRIRASREIAAAPPDKGFDDLMGPTLDELAQMSGACRAAGARLFVVYDGEAATADQYLLVGGPAWPGRLAQWLLIRSLRFEGAAVEKRLVEDGARRGYELLSIDPERQALQDPANRLAGDYHWNARGAEIFGEAAARELASALAAPRP